MKWDDQLAKAIKSANSKLAQIKNSFVCLDPEIVRPLYLTLVRPHLEYAVQVWNPHFEKDVKALEKVQRRATKLPPQLKKKPYQDRLGILNLTSLEIRRERGDLIEFYKITKGFEEINWQEKPRIRPPDIGPKLRKSNIYREKATSSTKTVREEFFLNRVIPHWNKLPGSVKYAPNVNSFENEIKILVLLSLPKIYCFWCLVD